MYLIYINNPLFVILTSIFLLILSAFVLLLIYFFRYVNSSRSEKKAIYTELNKAAASNSIVFLGDSLTDFYRTNEFFLNLDIYNRGIAGDTTDDILNRLYENVINIKPRKLFLQIGTNDLGNHKKPNYVINNIKKIVYQIQKELPTTEILIISLYPINSMALPFSKLLVWPRKNHDINFVNQEIAKFAHESNLTFIDVASHLKDEKGNLKKEYTIEGLHLSLSGYAKITEILEPYVF